MYTLSVTSSFRAGHQLTIAGATEPYHSHDWQIKAAVTGKKLDKSGLLIDFHEFKRIIDGITAVFEDKKLEDCPEFEKKSASAENIAAYIYNSIKPALPNDLCLLYVEITEMPGYSARYSGKTV